jgi:hypothetical protein
MILLDSMKIIFMRPDGQIDETLNIYPDMEILDISENRF